MNKDYALEVTAAFKSIFELLPDELILNAIKDALPNIIDNGQMTNEEISKLITHYRNHDVHALKIFVKRMCDDITRELNSEA